MKLKRTQLHIAKKSEQLSAKAKVGVSLHCHTEYSKEMLDFVPHYADQLPIIAFFWKRERKKYIAREGKDIAFDTAYWSPPMSESTVYDLEKQQINHAGLDAIVSLTDHDSIESNLKVNEQTENAVAPISLEWTVPFDIGFFHVGVHNLPKENAQGLSQILLDYTFNKEIHSTEKLNEVFAMLDELPGVLVVLNHPLWDIELVGKERHRQLLRDFIKLHGQWIHAFEINGFRKWSENKAVIELAEALDIPIVTGGDRHGCKPNTVINLTNAKTFEEFADEVRNDRHTEVVLMPAYSDPLHWRQLQSFSEILSSYPDFREGRQKWFDRVFFDIEDGNGLRPLSDHWINGGPLWLRLAIRTLGFMGGPVMKPVFKIAEKKVHKAPKSIETESFKIPDISEVSGELS